MAGAEILGFLDRIDLDASHVYSLSDDLDRAAVGKASIVAERVRDTYSVDLSADYAGVSLPHPFGKAAGQLSLNESQVSSDRESGLSFTVLKSAVGVTVTGEVGIEDWEKSAPAMVLEPRVARDGRTGWTVTWKGRGWDKGFNAYLGFYRDALGLNPGYPVIPSLMVDVTDRDRAMRQAGYCLAQLMEVHRDNYPGKLFLVEIDISPTLFLLPDADRDEAIPDYVRTSVAAFRHGLRAGGACIVKLPNADRGPEFQLQLAKAAIEEGAGKIAGLIVGNRLFDPDAEFGGQKGIAYGGYDLSNANLETLDRLAAENVKPPLIGTGNICSGRMMAEYALRGCTAGELHTFFQLPPSSYRAPQESGGRTWRALRELLYHPDDGLIAVLLKLAKTGMLERMENLVRFLDLPKALPAIKEAQP